MWPIQAAIDQDSASPLLVVRDVAVRFGGVVALDGVSFAQRRGEVLGLIGPNGAGKTTLFNCLSRLYEPSAGDILFDGQSILNRPAQGIAEIGIGRTFQNVALFPALSVFDNIRIGGHVGGRADFVSNALRLPWARREEAALARKARELLSYLDLDDVAGRPAGGLPFGTQKRVEIARALATGPKLLLLDEPAGGLNHEEVEALGRLIRRIRAELGISILLVEHHMNLVMSVSDSVVVLNFGRSIAHGSPISVQRNPDVIAAYLGNRKHAGLARRA
jgi:branched-chain amino acid transport system ATP-binding protein